MGNIKAGQVIEVEIHSHSELMVRKADGSIEVVRGAPKVNPQLFKRIKASFAAQGRGEVLSYENHTKSSSYTVTAADAATASSERIERAMRAGDRA